MASGQLAERLTIDEAKERIAKMGGTIMFEKVATRALTDRLAPALPAAGLWSRSMII